MSERAPTLAEVFRVALEANRRDLHTLLPGKVVKVHRGDGTILSVDVQPLIKASYIDASGTRQIETLPVVTTVPVAFQAAGGFAIKLPVRVGDTGSLAFSEASIDRWLSAGALVDPGDDRRHHLSDGVFYPGLRAGPWSVEDDRMYVGHEEGVGLIQIFEDEIRAGGQTPVVLAPDGIEITCTGGTISHNLEASTVLKAG